MANEQTEAVNPDEEDYVLYVNPDTGIEEAVSREQYEVLTGLGAAGREVTAAELGERETERALEEAYGDLEDQILTGAERFAGAASFGLTDLAMSREEREEAAIRARINPGSALTGELAGAIVPGLVSGGTGFVGTAARLTPAGRLGAFTTKLAASGGVTRKVAAGAIEGAIGAVGDAISRASLDENPDFSAEALVSSAIAGGAIGGGLGLLGAGAQKLAAKGADQLAEEGIERAARMADDLVPPTKSPVGLFGKAPTKRTSYKRIVRKKLADTSADNARALGARIDDMATASAARELDDLLIKVPTGAADDLADQARRLSAEYEQAAQEAKNWFVRYSDDVGLDKAKSKLTKEVSDEVEDAGILALQRLDQTAHQFDRVADELAARAGIPRTTKLATELGEAGAKLNRTLRDRVSGAGSRLGNLGQTVLGAGEVAQTLGVDTGLPSVRDIPIIGGLASLYLQAKTGLNVAKGRGLVPGSRVTQAAAKSVSLSDRISQTVRRVAEKGLRRTAVSPRALPIVPAQVAAQVAQVTSVSPTVAAEQVRAETEDTTDAVSMAAVNTAMRAQNYLAANAPRDPLPVRPPGLPPWEPNPMEAMDWSRRTWALQHPHDALTAALLDPTANIEVEAVRAVYPAIWNLYREGLAQEQAALAKSLSLGQRDAIGRNFDLPLTIANIPGYGVSIATRPDGGPLGSDTLDPRFAAPSAASTTPVVTLEETQQQKRPYT